MATTENVSVYQDMISKCVKIHSGSPAVYKLRTKKETIGNVTKNVVGDKKISKNHKTILLLGQSGAGKSTLINALVNHTMGVKFEDNIWFEIVEDEQRSQSESQTSNVTVYEIFGFEGKTLRYSLTIIDTPGYGDCRGSEYDERISRTLFDLFTAADGVHEISAVGLVMKGSENRLTDQLRGIIDSVMSVFGKYLEKNIVTLITHSNGIKPLNVLEVLNVANVKCAKDEKNQPVYVQFDNCQNTERTGEDEDAPKNAWTVAEKGMSKFSYFLEKSKPQNLKQVIEMMNTSNELTACLVNLQTRIGAIDEIRKEIQNQQKGLRENVQLMFSNENFCIEYDENYTERIHVKFHYLLFFDETKCVDEIKTKRVQKIQEGMKKEYEKNRAESQQKLKLLETLEGRIRDLTPEKNRLFEESYQLVLKLDNLSLDVDQLDLLIEKMMAEEVDAEKVQTLKKRRRRMRRS